MGRKNLLSLFAVVVAWFTVVVIHIVSPPNNPISWDTFGYYLYLPLTFIYHDLGIQHKEVIDHIFALYDPSTTFYQATHIPGGNWMMKYSMGMAVLYAPGFFVAHLLAPVLGYPADGFSTPYQVALVANSVLFFMVGYWYFRKVLLHFFNDKVAALVLLSIFFGTNYYSYSVYSPETAHNYLFAYYALLLWFTIRWHQTFEKKYMVTLALLIGLATLSRPTELISVLIPLFWNVDSKKVFLEKIKDFKGKYRKQLMLFMGIMMAIGSLQIIYWKIYSGSFIYYSYVNPGEGFEFFSPYILKVLFSFRKGWFIYTPMMLFAVAGFWFIYKKNRKLFYPLFIFFVINFYIISSWSCWWYAQSMGQRALVQSYAVMGIPFGFFIQWIGNRKLVWKLLFGLLALFFIWLNIFQTWQLRHHIISGDRMTFAYYVKTFGKTEVNPEDKKLLLVQRLYSDNKPKMGDESNYNLSVLKEFDFEDNNEKKSTHFTTRYAHTGRQSLKMDSTLYFSSVYKIPFKEMTNHYYAWIRVTVWVYPVHDLSETPSALVISFQHKGKNYRYRALDINGKETRDKLKLNQWNKVEMTYLTPEVRNQNDNLVTYIWNRGKKDIYFDDLKVELLEPKNE